MTKFLTVPTLLFFLVSFCIGPIPSVYAQDFRLPKPGVMVHLSPPMNPPILKGLKVHPENPLKFDFILDQGDVEKGGRHLFLKDEANKLIKYFLASLTTPEKDLWVNLSPYEKDRIVPNSFGQTEMGRDLLAQDYMLKQITASLIYPEDEIGKKFWKRVYEEAAKKYNTTNIPVNTFNKVWIVPEKAVVYENAQAGTAYVVESRLKVMLEEDYLSLEKHLTAKNANTLGSQIVREVVIPELTKEINEGANFAQLRQVYNSLILATWYKKKIKDSILSQVYADKNKTAGIDTNDPQANEKIYQQYLQAFKKGVYNYIKEDLDPVTQETIPRKYFSGGVNMAQMTSLTDAAMSYTQSLPLQSIIQSNQAVMVEAKISAFGKGSILPQELSQDIKEALNNQTITAANGKIYGLVVQVIPDLSSANAVRVIIKLRNDKGKVSNHVVLFSIREEDTIQSFSMDFSNIKFDSEPQADLTGQELGRQILHLLHEVLPDQTQLFGKVINRNTLSFLKQNFYIDGQDKLRKKRTSLKQDEENLEVSDLSMELVAAGEISIQSVLNEMPIGAFLQKGGFVITGIHTSSQQYAGTEALKKILRASKGDLADYFNIDFVKTPSGFAQLSEDNSMVVKVGAEEAAMVLNKVVVHGRPLNEGHLSKTKLSRLEMKPQYKIELGRRIIYFSSIFKQVDQDRLAVLGYVQDGDSFVARTYYLSGSQGIWRYLPRVESDEEGRIVWYDKGYSQDSLPLPYQIQKVLAHMMREAKILEFNENEWVFLFSGTTNNEARTYNQKIDPKPERIVLNDDMQRTGEYPKPQELNFLKPEHAPDFNTLLETYSFVNPIYGLVTARVFPSLFGSYKYTFMEDSKGRSWIASIETNGPLNSLGLSDRWVEGGTFTMPAYEYPSATLGYGNYNDIINKKDSDKVLYVDMYEAYLSRVPVIKEFQRKYGQTQIKKERKLITAMLLIQEDQKDKARELLEGAEEVEISQEQLDEYLKMRESTDFFRAVRRVFSEEIKDAGIREDYFGSQNTSVTHTLKGKQNRGQLAILVSTDAAMQAENKNEPMDSNIILEHNETGVLYFRKNKGSFRIGEHTFKFVFTGTHFKISSSDFGPAPISVLVNRDRKSSKIWEIHGLSVEFSVPSSDRISNRLVIKNNSYGPLEINAPIDQEIQRNKKDSAMKGGIDFTTEKTPLKIEGSDGRIDLNFNPEMLKELQNVPGFVPVIINITPITDLRGFLGVNKPVQDRSLDIV